MIATTFSATGYGIDGACVEVQASRTSSPPAMVMTGLPGDVVRESRDRIRAALGSLGYDVPSSKTLVHFSPANIKKQGSQFDLAVTAVVLEAEGLLPPKSLHRIGFLGELTLDGRLKRTPCILPLLDSLIKRSDIEIVVIPELNRMEAALLRSDKIRVANNLAHVINFLRGHSELENCGTFKPAPHNPTDSLDDVLGQGLAKRALQIAVAGNHHLLMMGSPGVGKSMLAQRALSLLPALSHEEWLEHAKCFCRKFPHQELPQGRPFRAPHHSASTAAFLGGGHQEVQPGEVSLAHRGILFLDEFPEFRRDAIEGLREPLQDGHINISRANFSTILPARFSLIAAMNPCPCGYQQSKHKSCVCSWEKILAYQRKISGPIFDRIDVRVTLLERGDLGPDATTTSAFDLKNGIERALAAQRMRYQSPLMRNAEADVAKFGNAFTLDRSAHECLDAISGKQHLNYRSLYKLLRVARTIADIDGKSNIQSDDLILSWSLRCSEWQNTQRTFSSSSPHH